ncbi:MAG: patatin-like phospholipase family protein [Gammaproteobacteria bacterium]|nr:patatin-like phospholipase family protein [Gammaproteobacteria bacterium]
MTERGDQEPRIGLALSGGGSRAIAFHLGCLRALDDIGVMDKVVVLSTVSGSSVIGAIYSAHEGTFSEFEDKVRAFLLGPRLARGTESVLHQRGYKGSGMLGCPTVVE